MLPDTFRDTGLSLYRADDVTPTRFQVLGERGTGTNLARKLLEKNTHLERSEALGWKHALPHMVGVPADMVVICVVRHAESWALSMHKRPWHAHPALQSMTFSDFIRAPWHGIVDRPSDFAQIPEGHVLRNRELQFDRHPITGLPFANLFALRRVKQAGLLGMLNRGCNVVFVQTEMVQRDPEGYVERFRALFDLKQKGKGFRGVHRRLGNLHKVSVTDHPETPREMTAEDRAFMIDQLDLAAETALGYHYGPGDRPGAQ
ncbi:MAG: hypothetical protein CSA70_05545 [Rhodobacterales bacterium]|nr:MAG: hypothetical protein CSA70_05545 [Rhodobacterales bacterium]